MERFQEMARAGAPIVGSSHSVEMLTPTLVVHGTDDWLVPPFHGVRLHAAAGDPRELVLVERGLHAENMLAEDPEPLLQPVVAFFDRALCFLLSRPSTRGRRAASRPARCETRRR